MSKTGDWAEEQVKAGAARNAAFPWQQCMISQQATRYMVGILVEEVGRNKTAKIIGRLLDVPGNAAFRDAVRLMQEEYESNYWTQGNVKP